MTDFDPFKIDDSEVPVVSKDIASRNSSAIRAALAILYDIEQLGHVRYVSTASTEKVDGGWMHRNVIDIRYIEKEAKTGKFGDKGVRDPDFPCEVFDPGEPEGDCAGDGHYLCNECTEREDK